MSHIFHTVQTRFRTLTLAGIAAFIAFSVAAAPYSSAPVSASCSSSCVASMSASPAGGSYNPNNTVTVSVYVNSGGQTVNTVQADFTYSSSLLEFQSINSAGSAFSIDASSSGGGGSVSIARGNVTAVSGTSLLVAQVNFKVIGSAGTAAISFSNSSIVASSTTNQDILGSVSGASYTVTTPPAPTPTPPASGSGTPSTPSSGTAPKPSTSTPSTATPSTTTPAPTTTGDGTAEPTTNTTDTPTASNPDTNSETPVKRNNTLIIVLASVGVALVAAGTGASWWFLRRRHRLAGPELPPLAGFVGSTSPSVTPSASPEAGGTPVFGPAPTSQSTAPSRPAMPSQPIGNTPSVHHSDVNGPFTWGS